MTRPPPSSRSISFTGFCAEQGNVILEPIKSLMIRGNFV